MIAQESEGLTAHKKNRKIEKIEVDFGQMTDQVANLVCSEKIEQSKMKLRKKCIWNKC